MSNKTVAALLRTLKSLMDNGQVIEPEGAWIWDEGRWKHLTLAQVAAALHEAVVDSEGE